MSERTFRVGAWARQRTAELAEPVHANSADLSAFDDIADTTLSLLRAHLSDCVLQAQPVHTNSRDQLDETIDLRDVKNEIDAVVRQLNETRSQMKQMRDPSANLVTVPLSIPSPAPAAASAVVPIPEQQPAHAAPVHELKTLTATENRISKLEAQLSEGTLTDAQFATAMRAVLLKVRA